MIENLQRLLGPLRTRVANLVARAAVSLADDSAKLQLVQLAVLDGETRDGCERFQEYGFTSVPEEGAEAVVLFPGGRRDHGLVVAVDDRRHRPTGLAAGEVAVYNRHGLILLLKSGRAALTAPEVRLGSDAASAYVALANLVDARIAAVVATFNAHVHTSAAPGSPTSSPVTPLAAQASVAAGKVKAE